MRLSIKNLTSNTISTPIGSLSPAGTISGDVPDGRMAETLLELSKFGSQISYSTDTNSANVSTSTPITMYVSQAGDDTASGLTETAPLKTLNEALNRLPLVINHAVNIKLTAGEHTLVDNFPAFILNAALTISGAALTTAILSQGITSGTFDSSWATQTVPHTAVCSGGGWATNELKGKYLKLLDGPSAGSYLVIAANTATTVDITRGAVPALGSGGYALPNTSFTIVEQPTSISVLGGTINYRSLIGQAVTAALTYQDLKIIGRHLTAIAESTLRFNRCYLTKSTTGTAIIEAAAAAGRLSVNDTFMMAPNAASQRCINSAGVGNKNVSNSNVVMDITAAGGNSYAHFITGNHILTLSNIVVNGASQTASAGIFMGSYGVKTTCSGDLLIRDVVTGININDGGQCSLSSPYSNITTFHNCTTAIMIGDPSYVSIGASVGGCTLSSRGATYKIQNCTTGIQMSGCYNIVHAAGFAFNTCTTAINMHGNTTATGNVLLLSTLNSMTACTNEILMDGSTNTALAAVRAAPAKRILNSTLLHTAVEA